ncbi:hypothetical protein GCE9029_01208 [Grimontia celer]|uniref:Uncharacterized protein n=1 Tax=Grimontia celer TaxID=1796497 RepID=A0A128EYB9_9GAMM|nr:hypothetical protein [Grimontia celer]CZF79021.1 hypothetical protein GCE9029_01208 [Grimontia celer]
MKLILSILGKLWGAAVFAFIALQFYKSSGNEIPDIIRGYVESIEQLLFSFVNSEWFFAVFVVGWFVAGYYLSRTSGWSVLADRYHLVSKSEPDLSFTTHSGVIGGIRHKGTLRISTSPKGLYAKMLLPFKFGHKNLFIPWSDIESAHLDQKSNLLKFNFRHFKDLNFEIYNSNSLNEKLPNRLFKGM